MFTDNIPNNSLIICNSKEKEYFIKKEGLHNYKCITFNEFIKKYFFDYDENTILYIMNKYKIKYEVAKVYIENIYYINNKDYKSNKLSKLKDLKKDLEDNNLLIYNTLFKEYLKDKLIIFYNINLDEFYLNKFKDLKYQIINEETNNYNHNVIEFSNQKEEIEYVAYKISELIYNKINIKNIKLTNIESDYYEDIERIFSLYNLKVDIPYKSPLSSFNYIKEFINNLKDKTIEESLDLLDKENSLYNELIRVINKNIKYNNKDLIILKLDYEYIESTKYSNSIQIIDLLDYIPDENDYIFLLGFNDKIIPKSYKDTNYITDNLKEELKLKKTYELNIELRNKILNKIKNIKNLTITYKLKDDNGTCYISTLGNNFNIEKGRIPLNISYSEEYNKIKLADRIDTYIKYNEKSEDYEILNYSFKINYNSFDNTYHKINRKLDKLALSYTKMKDYNECSFKYYLNNILKLDKYEETFSITIGNMVHYALEQSLKNNDSNIQKYAKDYIKDYTFTNKETFFINRYINYLDEILNHIKEEKKYMKLDNSLYEKQINIPLEDNINFMGKIDKVLYKEENNQTYLALIDYKTGNDDISLKYLKYGLNMQLPIYLYLSKYLEFKNIIYCGFYLQKLNLKEKDYRLQGYSNSDKSIISYLDEYFENSKIIKGLSTNKDGSFKAYSKVLSNEEIDKIINITNKLIYECMNNIKDNNYIINPKKDLESIISCKYCKYKDICFVKNQDYVEIKETSLEEL